jgi:outer membrane protein assembly factor BamB
MMKRSIVVLAVMFVMVVGGVFAGLITSAKGESTIVAPILEKKPSLDVNPALVLTKHPWPMFRHDLNHTGRSQYDTSMNDGNKKWEYTTGSDVYSSPAIGTDGTIYVGSSDHNLYAVYPNGTKKWEFATNDQIVYSSPAIGVDGTIYVGSLDNKLYAIYPNGTKKWEFATGGFVGSSPTLGADGIIYVGSYDARLYAIYPNGTKKWEFVTGDLIISSPAIGADGTIYVGSRDNKLYAVYPNGTKKWNFVTVNLVDSSAAIGADGTIYVGSYDNKLYAIYPNGTMKWGFITGNYVYSSPAIGADGTIYVGSYDNKLYAIYPNGTKKWDFTAGNVVGSSPTIGGDGTIYVGSRDNKLYAINSNGTKKWEFGSGKEILSSPAIGADGTIYVGSRDSKLYAIESMAPPSAPQIIQTIIGDAQITLTWIAPTSDGGTSITNYKIYWGTTSGVYSNNSTIGNVLSHTVTGLTNGGNYYFVVSAVNAVGEGPKSSEVNAIPNPASTILTPIWNKTWGGSDIDIAKSIVVDNSNIYIAGVTGDVSAGTGKVLLLGYNLNGVHIWNTTWAGGNSEGKSITKDDSGIYLAGLTSSSGMPSKSPAIIQKYNFTGNLTWHKTWGGSAPEVSIAYSIAVDNTGVYVAGSTGSSDKNVCNRPRLWQTPTSKYIPLNVLSLC